MLGNDIFDNLGKKYNNKNINWIFYVLKVKFKVYKNKGIKIKHVIDVKINLYSDCIDCGSKMFVTINKEEIVIYWKFYTIYKTTSWYCFLHRKKKIEIKKPSVN